MVLSSKATDRPQEASLGAMRRPLGLALSSPTSLLTWDIVGARVGAVEDRDGDGGFLVACPILYSAHVFS